jgi:N-acetylmuramoyl-L-alanine amidase
MSRSIALCLVLCPLLIACAGKAPQAGPTGPLDGRTIVLDPGHGGTAATDSFRVGPTGEREEWVNLRVAKRLAELLEARGATVVMTRKEDVAVGLKARADLAREVEADVFLSIHHNATADPAVNFPIIYYHGYASANRAGVRLGRLVARRLAQRLYDTEVETTVVSDQVIFPGSGTAVLRHSYGIPGVIGEASFFTNPAEEERLRDPDHNQREAEAYLQALQEFFGAEVPPVLPKGEVEPLEPFAAAQEAERMSETALRWREDFLEGRRLIRAGALDRGYDLVTRSIRSFPDSPVAREAHLLRAEVLARRGQVEAAEEARRRAREFYAGG